MNSTQSIAKTGILFIHKLTQFGCTVDGPVVNDQLFQIGEWRICDCMPNTYLFKASKQPHIYENNLVFCSFVLSRKQINNIDVPVCLALSYRSHVKCIDEYYFRLVNSFLQLAKNLSFNTGLVPRPKPLPQFGRGVASGPS